MRGGSFLLRLLRGLSKVAGLSTVVPVRTGPETILFADFADERLMEALHEVRGEEIECDMIRSILTEGDTFVDIGANFGTLSLLASRIVGRSGKVIAVEPQPRLARLIEQSLQSSGIVNCDLHEVACGSAPASATLLIPENDSGRAGFFPGFSGRWKHRTITVQVTTLDTLASTIPVGGNVCVKIDAEGSEFAILDGGRAMIAARKPALLIELNPWSARAAGRSVSELLSFLTELGYVRFATESTFPATTQLQAIPVDRQTNLLAYS